MIHPGELLSAYLDGELSPDEATWVVGHLERCAACRLDLADVQSARAAIRALPVLDAPGWLRAPEKHPRRRRQRTPVAAAAAALLALAVGLSALFAPSPEVELPFADIAATHGVRSVQDGMTVSGGMAELVTILDVPGAE